MSELQMRYEDQVRADLRVEVDQAGHVTIMHQKADDSWEGHGYASGVWESIVAIAHKGQEMAAMLQLEAEK